MSQAAHARKRLSSSAPGPEDHVSRAGSGGKASGSGAKAPQRVETFFGLPEWPTVHILLFAVAFMTRMYRLEQPRGEFWLCIAWRALGAWAVSGLLCTGVVFDEFHFGRFLNQYSKGTYFFDIHPPLGKLVMLASSILVGYDADRCSYKEIHHQYADDCKFLAIRFTCALTGCLCVPLVYSVVRRFGGSMWGGILSAFLFTFDNLNLIESRLILTDSQLMLYMVACLYVALCFYERWERHCDAEDAIAADPVLAANPAARAARGELTWLGRQGWLLLLSAACCASISVKWTGLATPALVALEVTFCTWFLRRPLGLPNILQIGATVILLYSAQWAVHFALLPLSGDGDAFMREEFQRQLVGNQFYNPDVAPQSFWLSMWQLNAEMLSANARIETPHHWMSKWHSWPVNARGVLYYSTPTEDGAVQMVYLLGNPAAIWFVGAVMFIAVLMLLAYCRMRHLMHFTRQQQRFFAAVSYLVVGYVANLMPYIAVNRAAFIYHYMPALLYGEILAGVLLDRIFGRKAFAWVVQVIMAAIFAVWLFFAPWVYGIPLSNAAHARRRWMSGWD